MCGISGIVNINGIRPENIKAMTDIICHRGPDGEGFAFFGNDKPIALAGGKDTNEAVWTAHIEYSPIADIDDIHEPSLVAFGHRRLSIIDLSPAGHQPMCYAGARYWITYNGEIYNYKELREELTTLGHSFHSKTDTEVILAAYAQWGKDCLERFNGMWAFAIYDSLKKEIFLSRDRFGIKPLYYWFAPDDSFSFASEIKQFTTLPGWVAKLNAQRAYDYLVYSITDHTEETMFDGVYQIPGGYYLKIPVDQIRPDARRKIIPKKWYDFKYKKFTGSFKEAAVEFEMLFKKAVALQLRSDVPVGSALSGGLDSSAIVCEVNNILTNQQGQHLQKTFSSCSTDERYNERKWVDIVLGHKSSIDAHFIYPSYKDIFTHISKLTWHHDEPYQSQSAFLGYCVFQSAINNGVKVLLNGQGADEYLGGYGQFAIPRQNALLKRLKWRSLFFEIRNSNKYLPIKYLNTLLNVVVSTLPVVFKNWLAGHFGHYNAIKDIIDNKALGAANLHPYNVIKNKHQTVPEISAHFTLFSTLPKYLKWEDRNSMANSVEARVPFLDHRLVEFSYNLPDDYLDFGGENKRVLREGLKDILPEAIRYRRDKKGFITPEERWVKEDNPVLFRTKLKEAIDSTQGIVKANALNYFDEVVAGKIPFDYTYWRIIQFAEWMRLFNVTK